MRQSEQNRGFVLKCIPFQERHRIVTIFTELRGKSSILARNSIQSRRFGGALEPFSLSLLNWSPPNENQELGSIQEAQIIHSFGGFGSKQAQLELYTLASLLNEIAIRTLPEGSSSQDLFKLHINALILIEAFGKTEGVINETEIKNFIYLVLIQYILKTLIAYGHTPQTEACSKCMRGLNAFSPEEKVTFFPNEGFWICSNCMPNRASSSHLSIHSLLYLEKLKKISIKRGYEIEIPALEISQIYLVLEQIAVYHLVGLQKNPLQSLKMLHQLIGLKSNLLLAQENQKQPNHFE